MLNFQLQLVINKPKTCFFTARMPKVYNSFEDKLVMLIESFKVVTGLEGINRSCIDKVGPGTAVKMSILVGEVPK